MAADGLQYDPEIAIEALIEADPRLGHVISRTGPFGLEANPMQDPYQVLLRSIVYQQLSGKAAGTILGRVLALFGDGETPPTPDQILDTPDELLRRAGLSRAKTAAIKDLAARVLDGTVPDLADLLAMTDEEIVDRLVQVRGIGRWTVEMLLMSRLGRADVFPVHDLGIRKGYQLVYGLAELPKPKELERLGELWRPYRSVASWYLWRAVDQADTLF